MDLPVRSAPRRRGAVACFLRQLEAQLPQLLDDLAAGGRENRRGSLSAMIGPMPLISASAFGRGIHQRIDGAEFLGQQVGHAIADMLDRQARQQAAQAALFAGGDAVEQVLGRLLAHAFQFEELLQCQAVQIGNAVDQAAIDELIDDFVAQPLDVHGIAAGKGAEDVFDLADAVLAAGAAVEGAILVQLDRAAADGAGLGKSNTFSLPVRAPARSEPRTG